MIKVYCFTDIVEFSEEVWPRIFACRPIVGDYVESEAGAKLTIISICHVQCPGSSPGSPYLKIELGQ